MVVACHSTMQGGLMATRFAALAFLIISFKSDCGCLALLNVTNLRMENVDMSVTVLWDPLQLDEYVLYTLCVDEEPVSGCTSIERQSCKYEFLDIFSVNKVRVKATVNGVLKGQSEEKRFYFYDIPAKISSPKVTITRNGRNVTAYFKFLTLALEGRTDTEFEAKFTYYVNESLEKPIKKISTTEKSVSFATSVLNNATICVNARIKVDISINDLFSNFTRACITTNNIFPTSSILRLGVAVGIGALLVILLILLCKRCYQSTLNQTHPELPKDTALIIAMSNGPEEKDVDIGAGEGEKICMICEVNSTVEGEFVDQGAADLESKQVFALSKSERPVVEVENLPIPCDLRNGIQIAAQNNAASELKPTPPMLMTTASEFDWDRRACPKNEESAFCDGTVILSASKSYAECDSIMKMCNSPLSSESPFSEDEDYVKIPLRTGSCPIDTIW